VDFDLNDFIKDVKSITRALSFLRIIKLFAISIIIIVMYSIHERRTDLFNLILEPIIVKSTEPVVSSFVISNENASELSRMLQKMPAVIGIAVISVDVRQNLKTIKLKILDKKLDEKLDHLPDQSPLFTENGEMNNRTVILMSGEIYCMASSKGNLGSILPGLDVIVPFSCSVPIPPSYGDFSGWIFVGFDRPLTNLEMAKFKSEISKIAARIKKGG
jgi:hypothetical protein